MAQKTEEDLKKEDELLQRLVEIIEERNDIVENLIKDENRFEYGNVLFN